MRGQPRERNRIVDDVVAVGITLRDFGEPRVLQTQVSGRGWREERKRKRERERERERASRHTDLL